MDTVLLVLIYLAFISLGLPDAVLGAGWPVMRPDFGVPFAYAGFISMTISGGTILSAVFSSRVLKRFGTGRVTAVSVALTAIALAGFAFTPSFWWLLVAAIPLGLGAGAVDSGLNAYVAEHYESRHMSWLHSFWGVGAFSGPLVLSVLLAQGAGWRVGYLWIAILQAVLVILLLVAVPLWDKVRRRNLGEAASAPPTEHQPLFFPLKLKGAKLGLTALFLYCGIESTMGLWGGSFLFQTKGLDPAASATWVSMFYVSITVGRFLTGFVTYKMSNNDLIRTGGLVVLAGVVLLLLPLPLPVALTGFLLVGLGCAPLFPCMLHETPVRYGAANAPAMMGFQMATAYIGATFLPPLFGLVASFTTLALMPVFLVAYIAVLIVTSEALRASLSRSASPTPSA